MKRIASNSFLLLFALSLSSFISFFFFFSYFWNEKLVKKAYICFTLKTIFRLNWILFEISQLFKLRIVFQAVGKLLLVLPLHKYKGKEERKKKCRNRKQKSFLWCANRKDFFAPSVFILHIDLDDDDNDYGDSNQSSWLRIVQKKEKNMSQMNDSFSFRTYFSTNSRTENRVDVFSLPFHVCDDDVRRAYRTFSHCFVGQFTVKWFWRAYIRFWFYDFFSSFFFREVTLTSIELKLITFEWPKRLKTVSIWFYTIDVCDCVRLSTRCSFQFERDKRCTEKDGKVKLTLPILVVASKSFHFIHLFRAFRFLFSVKLTLRECLSWHFVYFFISSSSVSFLIKTKNIVVTLNRRLSSIAVIVVVALLVFNNFRLKFSICWPKNDENKFAVNGVNGISRF